ncbi:pentatricopeptide repeat-containing protein At2g26790, mitochondrial [Lactuca sativa]|uniref:pentatricopeptide repeat-containing protein At2g26790, mitochondrial n=1 Tax=Lactuca sativa TaxID=4236 RepID=UPI000CC2359B|nr:pentatricopeptide repeat-containing protein At2g26790, mitochondrial [Lactuca sativa]
MPPPFTRLASCCNLVKRSWNLQRVSSVVYTTCSDVSDSSSDTNVLCRALEKLGKFKVINETLLEQSKRERRSALLYMRELKESGFKHDLETYMAVVRLLCHWDWGMDARSNNVINDVIDNTNWEVVSFKISDDLFDALMEENLIKAVNGLLTVYASAGKFKEVIHTLIKMKRRGVLVVSTKTCNFIMSQLIKEDLEDIVEQVYRVLRRDGMIPNLYTYGLLLYVICKKGCLKEAWNVIEEMKEAGVEPDDLTYRMYIYALCCNGKTDLAFQLVKKLNKPLLNVYPYYYIIQVMVLQSKLQEAEDMFLEMKIREVVPNADCYGELIGGYCLKGDTDKTLDLCKEMESGGIKIDHKFVRRMMEHLWHIGKLDEALCLFKHFTQQSRVFIDEVSFSIAIDAACKVGKKDDAMGLIDEMKSRKIMPVVRQAQAGFQVQRVQPNMGQGEGVEGVPDACVQNEGVHDGAVQDARDQAAVGTVGQLNTTQQTLALHKLTSLNALHARILKKFRKSKRQVKMKD